MYGMSGGGGYLVFVFQTGTQTCTGPTQAGCIYWPDANTNAEVNSECGGNSGNWAVQNSGSPSGWAITPENMPTCWSPTPSRPYYVCYCPSESSEQFVSNGNNKGGKINCVPSTPEFPLGVTILLVSVLPLMFLLRRRTATATGSLPTSAMLSEDGHEVLGALGSVTGVPLDGGLPAVAGLCLGAASRTSTHNNHRPNAGYQGSVSNRLSFVQALRQKVRPRANWPFSATSRSGFLGIAATIKLFPSRA